MSEPRFILMEQPPKGQGADTETRWWYDTRRPLKGDQPYVAVQTYADQDPNNYRPIAGEMLLLFTDQAEYYAVCEGCYLAFRHMQWSGSTRGGSGWRQRAEACRAQHQKHKGRCEFCDPIFGNGGWRE
jgi:hypothetical protein